MSIKLTLVKTERYKNWNIEIFKEDTDPTQCPDFYEYKLTRYYKGRKTVKFESFVSSYSEENCLRNAKEAIDNIKNNRYKKNRVLRKNRTYIA